MDHHCPWVGNCVGHNNHKFFVQFLIYTTLGCLYSAVTMGIWAWKVDEYVPRACSESISMASILSASLVIALNVLLWTHLYFTFTSMSSVESAALLDFNPFFESQTAPVAQNLARNPFYKFFTFSRKNMY